MHSNNDISESIKIEDGRGFNVPRIQGHVYNGMTTDDQAVYGVLARINPANGMAELWSQDNHLGHIVSFCPVWTLEPFKTIHQLTLTRDAREHEDVIQALSRRVGQKLTEHISDTSDLRKLAALCNYLADMIDLNPSAEADLGKELAQ